MFRAPLTWRGTIVVVRRRGHAGRHSRTAMMDFEQTFTHVGYAAYLTWLVAGFADFACHRLSRLPETSGIRESNFHMLQIALIGGSVVLWLTVEPGQGLLASCTALAAIHAVFGYLDTRSAYGLRPITPLEQHVHSILDMAPWIAVGLLGLSVASGNSPGEWRLQLRNQALPSSTWFSVLFPAFALVAIPALVERAACRRARNRLARQRSSK